MIFEIFYCQNAKSTQTYSFEEANIRVQSSFRAIDAVCGTTHTYNIIPGGVERKSLDACLNVLRIKLLNVQINKTGECATWNVTDPSPIQCKSISYSVR
ncbi:MAG: hypothetical protein SFU98_04180 [Leptospiraceae bacterium]|nr:hypothetical protein [Leptospiraceae bacterium]